MTSIKLLIMKRLQYGFLVFSVIFYNSSLYAGEDGLSSLLKMLRSNNTITQEQYEALNKAAEHRKVKEEKEKSKEDDNSIHVSTEGGLEASTYDGEFAFEVGGTIMVDVATFAEDRNRLGNGTELRKAEMQLEGKMFGDWEYELEINFADSEVDVNDAYIKYVGFYPVSIIVGQFKESFSLEELTGSSKKTFMERSLINEFSPGRNIGVGVHHYSESWTAAAGIFGDDVNDDPKNEGDEGWGVTGRVTWSPFHSDQHALHLGIASSYREPDAGHEIDFATRPESHLTDVKYANTDDIDNVENTSKMGFEFANVHGPFSAQMEYVRVDVSRVNNAEDVTFDGWYIYGSYFLTGESRDYKFKSGKFGRVKPHGKQGAWEVALRYSTIDLNDGPITGGKEDNVTLGLNWYINERIKIMANYITVDTDDDANNAGGVTGGDNPNIYQVRMQADF